MGTIRVSRGFGDHDLCVMSSNVRLKPFLSCVPEVKYQIKCLHFKDISLFICDTRNALAACVG